MELSQARCQFFMRVLKVSVFNASLIFLCFVIIVLDVNIMEEGR